MQISRHTSAHGRIAALLLGSVVAFARPAMAQQTVDQVLSFLLVNRSVLTGDFVRDDQAAAAMRDAVSVFLRTELSTLPVNSPASGFTYRLDPTIGANVRSSDSFGPFFVERSLTGGKRQASFSVSYSRARFDNIDGRSLRDGTLVAIASQFHGDSTPFDAETLSLRIETRTTTISGHWGITDRLDLTGAVPLVTLTLSGERIDTFRGTPFPQAAAQASTSGVGDVLLRGKYNLVRRGGSGLSLGADVRLPTGNAQNYLGSGKLAVTPRLIASLERDRVGLHGDLGYAAGGASNELDYSGAITLVAARRFTLVGEALGRRLASGGELVDTIEPHPGLVGVDTIRLTSAAHSTTRLILVAGFRWNVVARGLLSANVLRPVSTAGLNAGWVPTVTFDYALGR